jgi:group I intron endonuclease
MNCGIYEILNTVNGKRYVGSAARFEKRFAVHVHHLRKGNHHSKYLQAAWNKHGEAAFQFKRLLLCSQANAVFFEQRAMDVLNPEYNIARVAGSCLGTRRSPEVRAKISLRHRGNKYSLGRKLSAYAKQMIGLANRRRKGFKRSPEAVLKTASAHRGMKRSDVTRARISAKAKLRKYSAETIEKRAAKLRGLKLSPDRVAHLLGNRFAAGRKPTPDESARRSASLKAAWAAKKAAGISWR